jgi:hypothetical protein
MKQKPETWTLGDRDLTLAAGQLIEYQDLRESRVARVQQVRVVSVPPHNQVIDVRLYGKLTRHDGRRERIIQPEQVLRTLDAPPPPPAKPLTSLWSPRDPENPFRIECGTLTDEVWRKIARWYPFSVRVLDRQNSVTSWQEQARTHSWKESKEAMTTLADLRPEPSYWVVMKCELRGKEGREKPTLWYPSQGSVLAALRETKKGNTI